MFCGQLARCPNGRGVRERMTGAGWHTARGARATGPGAGKVHRSCAEPSGSRSKPTAVS